MSYGGDNFDITVEEVRRLLHLPASRVRNGILLLSLQDGSVLRFTGYAGWIRIERLPPDRSFEAFIRAP